MNISKPVLEMVRRVDALKRLRLSQSQLHELVNKELLPGLIKVGPRASAFFLHELDEVLLNRAVGLGDDEIRRLVVKQKEDRLRRLANLRGAA